MWKLGPSFSEQALWECIQGLQNLAAWLAVPCTVRVASSEGNYLPWFCN